MKLVLHTPKNDIDETFEGQELAENSSLEVLKAKGWDYAAQKGIENAGWVSNAVMGNKPIASANKWYMHFSNNSFLVIE